MRKYCAGRSGFTFVELLIVIAILGILAAIIIPQLATNRGRSATSPAPVAATAPQIPNPAAGRPWPPIQRDGVAVQNDDMLRKNYYVILDGSGSMRDQGCSGDLSKFDSAIGALQDFMATIPAEANVGLFIFDEHGISERVPLGLDNRVRLNAALTASHAGGGTPLSVAVQNGYQALTRQAGLQLGYGEYHLVIVTDGEANPGFDPTPQVNGMIDGSAIVIHTIGYCIGKGHSLNQPGRTLYSTVDDAKGLSRELHAVLAEAEAFDVSQFR